MIGALGAVTVVAHGACYYAFGVPVSPIHHDTGWSLGQLGAVFSAGLAVNGAVGILGGRLSDRLGTRALSLAGVVGASGFVASSYATQFVAFAGWYAAGSGVVRALSFYHITQPAAARAHPADPNRAIVRLTIIGVFASPTSTVLVGSGPRGASRGADAGVASADDHDPGHGGGGPSTSLSVASVSGTTR